MTSNEAQPHTEERRCKAVFSDRSIYSLPKRTSNNKNIVDIVLMILDGDGPPPMKNLRPAEKTRTGADQFHEEHQSAYEAYGQPSKDKICCVHTHNNAFPKMHDELKKRRSTAQPTAFATNQLLSLPRYDQSCPACDRIKRRNTNPNSRNRRASKKSRRTKKYRTNSYRKDRDSKSRIKKSRRTTRRRYRSPSNLFKLSKIRTNKGCQCTSYYIPAETRSVSTFNDLFSSGPPRETNPPPTPSLLGNPNQSVKEPKSDIDSRNPETMSAPSISSYNSFLSMEHEPMIQ